MGLNKYGIIIIVLLSLLCCNTHEPKCICDSGNFLHCETSEFTFHNMMCDKDYFTLSNGAEISFSTTSDYMLFSTTGNVVSSPDSKSCYSTGDGEAIVDFCIYDPPTLPHDIFATANFNGDTKIIVIHVIE